MSRGNLINSYVGDYFALLAMILIVSYKDGCEKVREDFEVMI